MAKQLWFYTGSQDLYGPETLQQVDEQSKVVVQQLVAGLEAPVELVFKGVIKNPAAIRRALEEAEQAHDLVVGAGPVLAAEGVQGEHRELAPDGVPEHLADGLDAGRVALQLGCTAAAGPAAVAVGDEADRRP